VQLWLRYTTVINVKVTRKFLSFWHKITAYGQNCGICLTVVNSRFSYSHREWSFAIAGPWPWNSLLTSMHHTNSLLLLRHPPLGVRSIKRRHQSLEWMILSNVNCFIPGNVIGFQVLLDSLHPRSTRASWWSHPVLQGRKLLRPSWHLFHLAFNTDNWSGWIQTNGENELVYGHWSFWTMFIVYHIQINLVTYLSC